MLWFYDIYDAVTNFMETGGVVLWVIAILLVFMWSLVFERAWYFLVIHNRLKKHIVQNWNERSDIRSWHAHRIREALISRAGLGIDQNLGLIRTLIRLFPLLGLLGTVTGMIKVFDVLSIAGGGDIRSIADGVSLATIPTMAGMVAALSGVFAFSWLSRKAIREKELIHDLLVIER